MIIGHGDDGYLFQDKIVANFSSNVYYSGLSIDLKNHLSNNLDKVKNYPEADSKSLVKELSRFHNIDEGQLLITNGATEAFYLIAHTFRDASATVIVPAFSEYEDACKANDIDLEFLKWEDVEENTIFKTNLAFICNPNNPTGAVLKEGVLKELIRRNPQTTFVIDEAYIDFTNVVRSSLEFLSDYSNWIIVKSLTKKYAIPGLRLGYIISNNLMVQRISAKKMPWSVNALAIEAGKFILLNYSSLGLPVQDLLKDAEYLIERLNLIPGINAYSTNTNFFLCKTEKGSASLLKEFLIKEHGLLIRDASNFRSLIPQHFRVASQQPQDNELLIKGISAWMNIS